MTAMNHLFQLRARDHLDWPLGYSYLAVGMALIGVAFTSGGQTGMLCPFKSLTDIPCPSCGVTRCARAIMSGNPMDAFFYNPAIFLASSALAVYMVIDVIGTHRGFKLVISPSNRMRSMLLPAALVAAAVNWCYLVATGI